MDQILKALSLICITFITPLAWTCTPDGHGGFLPPNNLSFPANQKSQGLTETQYHSVINKLEKIYTPIAHRLGAELKIERKWENPSVNAGTYRDEGGKHWHINLYGGFARHPYISEDGFALVICHELGHHLGGAPKKLSTKYAKWSSNEGQADYFGTLKCLRQIFSNEDSAQVIKRLDVPDVVRRDCEESFSSESGRAVCIRSSMAGLAVGNVMADSQKTPLPSFETPDFNEVEETLEKHPSVQCRLDTYYQGAVCEVSHSISVSQNSETKGTCHAKLGHERGQRPSCWFKSF